MHGKEEMEYGCVDHHLVFTEYRVQTITNQYDTGVTGPVEMDGA